VPTLREIPVGQIFQFRFDEGSKWVYKKIEPYHMDDILIQEVRVPKNHGEPYLIINCNNLAENEVLIGERNYETN
jgi:hypothetical protein